MYLWSLVTGGISFFSSFTARDKPSSGAQGARSNGSFHPWNIFNFTGYKSPAVRFVMT